MRAAPRCLMQPTPKKQPTQIALPIAWLDCTWHPRVIVHLDPARKRSIASRFGFNEVFERRDGTSPYEISGADIRWNRPQPTRASARYCRSYWITRLRVGSHLSILSTFPLNLMK